MVPKKCKWFARLTTQANSMLTKFLIGLKISAKVFTRRRGVTMILQVGTIGELHKLESINGSQNFEKYLFKKKMEIIKISRRYRPLHSANRLLLSHFVHL